jgi:hypothetical protein
MVISNQRTKLGKTKGVVKSMDIILKIQGSTDIIKKKFYDTIK